MTTALVRPNRRRASDEREIALNPKAWIILGGLMGGLGVVAGAFGAHGLEKAFGGSGESSPQDAEQAADNGARIDNFETAVRYQMYHAPALVLVGLLAARRRSWALELAGWTFLVGILLFSGLLYAWVFTQVRILVLIVPFGGAALIVGWFALAWAGARAVSRRNDSDA